MPVETAPPLSRSGHPVSCPEGRGTCRRSGGEWAEGCWGPGVHPGNSNMLQAEDVSPHCPWTPLYTDTAPPPRALPGAEGSAYAPRPPTREHFKEVTHSSHPPGTVRGLHRGHEVYRGGPCRAGQLGQVCPCGPLGGPGTRLQCHQAEGGEFGEKKRPSPGDPGNLMDRCLLAATCWNLLSSPAVPSQPKLSLGQVLGQGTPTKLVAGA